MKSMRAPDNCPGIQFANEWFPADHKGVVVLPDEYAETAKQHGFVEIDDDEMIIEESIPEKRIKRTKFSDE